MAVLQTGDLTIPTNIIDPWLEKVKYGSAVAALSPNLPMKFGKGESFVFDIGEAEYVGEGQNKGSSEFTQTSMSTEPFKFHKTVRWTEEVMWADEDHQLNVVSQILARIQPALSRALDFGVFHGINPTGGTRVSAMSVVLSDTENEVSAGDDTVKPYATLDEADALVLANDYLPSDVALNPSWASTFTALRGANSEQRLYPNFRLGTEVSDLDGHRASVSRTVKAAGVAAEDTGIEGFVGDFGGIGWGVQRSIGLEVIKFGDPDGQGDLKRNNQVAFRAEVVYGWGIADLDAFAKVTSVDVP